MSILCIGQAVYDITFPCDDTLIENQKYRIYSRIECIGAPAANASCLCALWNVDTTLIARIGNDLYGKEIIRTLKSAGVDTNYLYIDKLAPTSISCIISNKINGNRTILNNPMMNDSYPISFPDRDINVILMDGHELNASLQAMRHYPNAATILDAGTYKPEIKELISTVDFLVCSQDFAFQYTNIKLDVSDKSSIDKTFKKIHEINHHTIVITLGDQGALYEENGVYCHIPAYKSDVIDTTGAGDIFHGAFAYSIEKGYSLKDSVILSSAAGSLSVEKLGGYTSIPSLAKVKNKINSM